jgi:hypothetical protein
MPTVTLEGNSVKIPLELLDEKKNEGLVVLSIAPSAYLIIRSDALAIYPHNRLKDLGQAIELLHSLSEEARQSIAYSSRKRQGLKELREQGYPVSDGSEYGLQEHLRPDVTLEQVREGLASMQGSLAQEIIAERGER